jgi:hypothetical protein
MSPYFVKLIVILFGACLCGYGAYGVVVGKLYWTANSDSKCEWVYRKENPVGFWLAVSMCFLFGLIPIVGILVVP